MKHLHVIHRLSTAVLPAKAVRPHMSATVITIMMSMTLIWEQRALSYLRKEISIMYHDHVL